MGHPVPAATPLESEDEMLPLGLRQWMGIGMLGHILLVGCNHAPYRPASNTLSQRSPSASTLFTVPPTQAIAYTAPSSPQPVAMAAPSHVSESPVFTSASPPQVELVSQKVEPVSHKVEP